MEKLHISSGLKKSLIILEFLREADFNLRVSVGTFTNCRECGLTFMVSNSFTHRVNNQEGAFTFCVYEHRNRDEIIINGKPGYISLNGDLPYNGDSKYDYLESFRYNEHYQAAYYLFEAIQELAIEREKDE